jgi:hypothetical protein
MAAGQRSTPTRLPRWGPGWGLRLVKTEGPIFEYACHEGNYGLADILSGACAEEKLAAEKTTRQK